MRRLALSTYIILCPPTFQLFFPCLGLTDFVVRVKLKTTANCQIVQGHLLPRALLIGHVSHARCRTADVTSHFPQPLLTDLDQTPKTKSQQLFKIFYIY